MGRCGAVWRILEGFFAYFLGSDADGFVDGGDEEFAVADFAGAGGFDDGGGDAGDEVVGEDDLDFDLWLEIDGVFAAAVDFGVAFLAAETFDFGDGHAVDGELGEGVFYVFEFEGFDDGFDLFHWGIWVGRRRGRIRETSRGFWGFPEDAHP